VEAEADVYHTDYDAFDLLKPDFPLSREAIGKLYKQFEYALGQRHRDGGTAQKPASA
jgi:hypothetical protein